MAQGPQCLCRDRSTCALHPNSEFTAPSRQGTVEVTRCPKAPPASNNQPNPAARRQEKCHSPWAHLAAPAPPSWNSPVPGSCGHACPGHWMRPAAHPGLHLTSLLPLFKALPPFPSYPHRPEALRLLHLLHRRRHRHARGSRRLPELPAAKRTWQIRIQILLVATLVLLTAGWRSLPCPRRPGSWSPSLEGRAGDQGCSQAPPASPVSRAEGRGLRLIIQTATWWSPHHGDFGVLSSRRTIASDCRERGGEKGGGGETWAGGALCQVPPLAVGETKPTPPSLLGLCSGNGPSIT